MLSVNKSLGGQSLTRRLARVKENRFFELTVISVIILSALEIGVKTFELPMATVSVMHVLDLLITVFFLVEISIRFIAEENKKAFFKSGWNLFDTAIVLVSLAPVGQADMALLARLLRIFRVMRMISVVPELRVLINSLLVALPKLGYVILLMFIIFYIYAAVGSFLFESINPELWGNIAISMLTLFRVMTFEDWTDVMYETMAVFPLSWMFYISFIFLTAFAFLNMVIGIVVGVMDEERNKSNGPPPDKLEELRQQLVAINQQLQKLDPSSALVEQGKNQRNQNQ